METFNYLCHRHYLSDFIQNNYENRKEFVNKNKRIITESALSHFLSQTRKGSFTKKYKFKLSTWVNLIQTLNINHEEMNHLLLLKIKSDLQEDFGKRSKIVIAIDKLTKQVKFTQKEEKFILKALKLLTPRRKNRVYLTVFKEIDYFLGSKSRSERTEDLVEIRNFYGRITGEINGN